MRRTISTLICMMVVLALLSPAVHGAQDSSKSYNFQLTVNGDSDAAVDVGEEITITVKLDRTDAGKSGSYAMYSMQDETIYDSTYFSMVENSQPVTAGYDFNVVTMDDGIHKRVILSRLSFSPEGIETPDTENIATFKLKALRPKVDIPIISKNYKVNSKTANTYLTTANDVTVTIGEGTSGGGNSGLPGGGGGGGIPGVIEEKPIDELVPDQTDPSKGYMDLDQSMWYYEAVGYAIENGLFFGTSSTTFEPNTSMNRAMLVTVLWRLEGKPENSNLTTFNDVEEGAWYTNAVKWANANKIVEGYGNGLFGTNDNVTREQMASILYRYAQNKGYDASKTTALSEYTDAPSISSFAQTAMKWANAEGYITGRTPTTLVPAGSATRAEVASILMRFIEEIEN